MTDPPAAGDARCAPRLRLARAALLWERVWPAVWPALCVLGVFAVLALFDLLPALPGTGACRRPGAVRRWRWPARWLGLRAAGLGAVPDVGSRRAAASSRRAASRIARWQALADRPSGPLDGQAAALWEAHQRRMTAAVRRLRVGWPAAGLARRDPWGVRSVLAILLLLGAIDAGADWRERLARALSPSLGRRAGGGRGELRLCG